MIYFSDLEINVSEDVTDDVDLKATLQSIRQTLKRYERVYVDDIDNPSSQIVSSKEMNELPPWWNCMCNITKLNVVLKYIFFNNVSVVMIRIDVFFMKLVFFSPMYIFTLTNICSSATFFTSYFFLSS